MTFDVTPHLQMKDHDMDTLDRPAGRELFNKVPEITAFFWIIKVLATTVGETAADFLAVNLNLGLIVTSGVMAVALAWALVGQIRADRYTPWIYWLSVVLISIAGTLLTDYLVDDLGVSLVTTTAIFAAALAVTFALWWASERTLSIHTIFTLRRELFYWAAILFTFALGTAAGDLVAEGAGLGFGLSLLLFAALIGVVAFSYRSLGMNGVLAFWLAYILTRPLGASTGDLMSQTPADGGLGLGTVVTSGVFLAVILGLVVYLTISRVDLERAADDGQHA